MPRSATSGQFGPQSQSAILATIQQVGGMSKSSLAAVGLSNRSPDGLALRRSVERYVQGARAGRTPKMSEKNLALLTEIATARGATARVTVTALLARPDGALLSRQFTHVTPAADLLRARNSSEVAGAVVGSLDIAAGYYGTPADPAASVEVMEVRW